jgi:hypothetical protein
MSEGSAEVRGWVVGHAVGRAKADRTFTPRLVAAAALHSIRLRELDVNLPLSEQGPLHAIVHKRCADAPACGGGRFIFPALPAALTATGRGSSGTTSPASRRSWLSTASMPSPEFGIVQPCWTASRSASRDCSR